MNKKLQDARAEWTEKILYPFAQKANNETLSVPFYFGVSDSYIKNEKKLMIIGQEARDFGLFSGDWKMEHTQKWCISYSEYQTSGSTAANYSHKRNTSCFWRIFRIMQSSGISACWNNIDKLHRIVNSRTQPLPESYEKRLNHQYGTPSLSLLQREIAISAPKAIWFVTGPNYSFSMSTAFGINNDILSMMRPQRVKIITEISNILNMQIPAFWSYHPTYLNYTCGAIQECVNAVLKCF